MEVIRGTLPEARAISGSGDGYGYDSGSGSGDGSGSGYGSGSGSGDGSGDGYGDGSGDGSGYGSGSGSGDGSGDGYGDGSGYGSGDGSGSGSGDGSGDGYGDGSGSGSGDGSGSGSGYGDGIVQIAARQIPLRNRTDPRVIALWCSAADGTPANGGKAEPARSGLIQEVSGPLELCTHHALHATLQPEKWRGERLWIVALEGEVIGDDEKMGALKREILCEVQRYA